MAPHAGVIIAASVLVAASIAAYENPHIREWFEKSSQRVVLAFKSLGDDINGRKQSRRTDLSMHEDEDEKEDQWSLRSLFPRTTGEIRVLLS